MPIKKCSLLASAMLAVTLAPTAMADSLSDGIAQFTKKQYKEAIKSFDKAAAANSKSPTPIYYQAMCYYQLGDVNKAKALYSSIYKGFPNTNEAKYAATYLQRVDPKFVSVYATTSRPQQPQRNTSAAAAEVPEVGDMTSFDAANASVEELNKLPDTASVPFTHGPSGHLFIDAVINGRTIKMMFDTGASVCLIGKNQLDAAGVQGTILTGQRQNMGGVGNTVNSASPMVCDVRVGGLQRHMPIMVQQRFDLPPLLGQTFYNGYFYDIDNQAGVIRFTKKNSASRNIGYDVVEVPFTVMGNNLVVNAEVNGHNCPMFFDTGAGAILFDFRTFASMGLSIPSDAQMAMVGGVGGQAPAYVFRINSLRLGGVQKNNVQIMVATSGGPPLPLLEQPFFQDKRYTIDNDRKVIRFAR